MNADFWTLVFDGECAFCRKFVSQIGNLVPGPLLVATPYQEYIHTRGVRAEEFEEDVFLISSTGEILQGGDAIQRMISLAPSLKPFRWMIESGFGNRASRLAYGTLKRFKRCYNCSKRR